MVAEVALNRLQQQIEAIRREGFDEGYAAAMKAVHELAARPAPQQGDKPTMPNGSESETVRLEANQAASPLRTSVPVHRAPAKRSTARTEATGKRRSRRGRAKRGANAQMIQEILKNARRDVRQADIRNALQKKGVLLSFPSIRHALGQLEARRTAKQVGKSKTWRSAAA